MSSCCVYKVKRTGTVEHFGYARNSWGGAMLIWTELSKLLCGKDFDLSSYTDAPVWAKVNDGRVDVRYRIAIAFTFDGIWVKKKNIDALCEALAYFWSLHGKPDIATTLLQVIELLRKLEKDPTCIGACFNMTSVNSSPWCIYNDKTDTGRSVNVLRYKVDANGSPISELMEVADPV